MAEMLSLFGEIDKLSPNSLFVVHNSSVEQMTVAEIFDAERFTDFKAVSYVSSPKFFSDVIKDFQSVTFILGIDNSENLSKFKDGITDYVDSSEQVKFFNELSDDLKNSLVEERVQIRYGRQGVMIHDKIYLLANTKTGDYRVIIGSANLSNSAFDSDNLNFENVRVDDSKQLYDLYLSRFNYLLEQTVNYIPDRCRRSYENKNILLTVTPETNFDILIDKLEDKNFKLVVTEEQMNILAKRQEENERNLENIEATRKLVEVITSSKSSDGKFPLKKIPQIVKQKSKIQEIFHKVAKNIKKDDSDIRELLLTTSDSRLYKKNDAQSDEMNIYSMQVDRAEIKLALEKINAFTQAYIDFAVTPNPIIPSKIYEMILYAFTSPFIWQIRRKCSFIYDKVTVADIPLFCMLGGISGSGKSTALRFAANLMGQRGQEIYDYSKELDKPNILYNLIKSNNLMPVFVDEVGTSFFKGGVSPTKGENLIKSLSNEIPSEPMGAFIGTTNASEFSAPSQVMRRIYYIEVSSKFDTKKRRSKSITYLKKLMKVLTTNFSKILLLDFLKPFVIMKKFFYLKIF